MTHILEADSIQLSIGPRKILSDIYIKCETGRITGLLGRNGQGKTCLMNILYGSRKVEDKSVRYDAIPLPCAYKRPDILSYLPQFNFLPKSLTLKRIFSDFNLSYSLFEADFPEYQNMDKSSLSPLSAGQRRLVEVYIIMMSHSQFAMLDEPFSYLMPSQIEKIKELLLREKAEKVF
jgi:lipopolysaccharide export system ATP-binding protein